MNNEYINFGKITQRKVRATKIQAEIRNKILIKEIKELNKGIDYNTKSNKYKIKLEAMHKRADDMFEVIK